MFKIWIYVRVKKEVDLKKDYFRWGLAVAGVGKAQYREGGNSHKATSLPSWAGPKGPSRYPLYPGSHSFSPVFLIPWRSRPIGRLPNSEHSAWEGHGVTPETKSALTAHKLRLRLEDSHPPFLFPIDLSTNSFTQPMCQAINSRPVQFKGDMIQLTDAKPHMWL